MTALVALLAGCGGPGDEVTIDKTRLAAGPSKPALPGADLRSRLRMQSGERPAAAAPQGDPSNLFAYEVPEGWEELPPTQFRIVNLRSTKDPLAEITLSFLGGDGGGLDANLNRWRAQVGLEAATPAEVASYPKISMFGGDATYVEFEGSYQGMGGPKIEDGALYGAVLSRGGGTMFLKMTGPRETVSKERESFKGFVQSIALTPEAMNRARGGGDTADPHGPGGPPQAPPAASSGEARPSPLTWSAPAGWAEEAASSPFREVTFRRDGVEMYVSLARGGALPNINRWAGQLGLDELDAAGLEALPRAPMLGREAYVFEGEGTLKGMRDPAPKPDQRMLAALVEDDGLIVTVKATGPSAAVDALRVDFFELLANLAKR
ncbi:MAG: hypothetical protein AAF726_07400 [Planctomycetota bacterium]